ncbi:MAG: hypothetical protein AAFV47_06475 [Pseudomonadota bacterium]
MDKTNLSNITPLKAPRKTLQFRRAWRQYSLRYGDAMLAIEARMGRQQRVERHDLLLLNPLFVFEAYDLSVLHHPCRHFLLTLALAAIVHFSAFSSDLPLLAPALSLLSLYWLVRMIHLWRDNGPRTVICDTSGNTVVEIPHGAVDESLRLGFESGLRKNIETRDARWHNGEL